MCSDLALVLHVPELTSQGKREMGRPKGFKKGKGAGQGTGKSDWPENCKGQ